MKTYKMIQVGTGGHGAEWRQLGPEGAPPPNIEDGLVEVVAAVDINPDALKNARAFLGLRADQCYTDILTNILRHFFIYLDVRQNLDKRGGRQ